MSSRKLRSYTLRVVLFLVTIIGIAGIPDDVSTWGGWLGIFWDWGIAPIRVWASGLLTGISSSALLFLLIYPRLDEIASKGHILLRRLATIRVGLESSVWGTLISYRVRDITNDLTVSEGSTRLRIGRTALISTAATSTEEREVELQVDVVGRYHLTMYNVSVPGDVQGVLLRPYMSGWSDVGSRYIVAVPNGTTLINIRVSLEDRAKMPSSSNET